MKAGAKLVPASSYQREHIKRLLGRLNLSTVVVTLANRRVFQRAGIDAQDGHSIDDVLYTVSRHDASQLIGQLEAESNT